VRVHLPVQAGARVRATFKRRGRMRMAAGQGKAEGSHF